MKALRGLLERPLVYRLWQAPFAEKKFLPVAQNNDLASPGRVLDVGCGPGTNSRHFPDASYTGIELNERYVRTARALHRKHFIAADALTYPLQPRAYDFILVNSLLHHLSDADVRQLLRRLASAVTVNGHIHILELEMPRRISPARVLAKLDRGRYARSPDHWRSLFAESLSEVLSVRYRLRFAGLTLWRMLYFKGRALNR